MLRSQSDRELQQEWLRILRMRARANTLTPPPQTTGNRANGAGPIRNYPQRVGRG